MNKFLVALATVIASLGVAEQASAYYAAHLGRFLTRDPAGEIGVGRIGGGEMAHADNSMELLDRDQNDPYANYDDGLNLYQYVNSMPVELVDPSGLAMSGSYPRPSGTPCYSGGGRPPGSSKLPPCPPAEPGSFEYDYEHYITPGNSAPADPVILNWGSEAGFGAAAAAGSAAGGCVCAGANPVLWGGGAAAGGAAATGGTGWVAVVSPGLPAGTYPALGINGTVYIGRAHIVCLEMAGGRLVAGDGEKYGMAIINAAGQFIGWAYE